MKKVTLYSIAYLAHQFEKTCLVTPVSNYSDMFEIKVGDFAFTIKTSDENYQPHLEDLYFRLGMYLAARNPEKVLGD